MQPLYSVGLRRGTLTLISNTHFALSHTLQIFLGRALFFFEFHRLSYYSMLRSLYRKPHFLLPLVENPMNCIHVFPTFENPAKLPTPAQGIYSTSASSLLISVLKIWGHLRTSTPIPKHPGCCLFTVPGHENLR